MFHVWDGWKSGMSIFSVPLSWYRSVTGFLNHFAQGRGIELEKPDNPSLEAPVLIKLSDEVWDTLEALKETKAPPELEDVRSGYEMITNPQTKDPVGKVAGAVNQTGYTLNVLCRAATDGASVILHFRRLTITSDGRIQSMSAEEDAISVYPGE